MNRSLVLALLLLAPLAHAMLATQNASALMNSDSLDSGQVQDIRATLVQNFRPIAMPDALRSVAANQRLSVKLGNELVGCLSTSDARLESFSAEDCTSRTMTMTVTPQGLKAIIGDSTGGADSAKAILKQYNSGGIKLSSDDTITNVKLFFLQIAAWFGGWFA